MNAPCKYQLDIPPEGIHVSNHLHHTIHTGMQQQFPIFCQSGSSGSSMHGQQVCMFWKNHIMRNRNNCIHVRITRLQCCAVLNEGHFATPTDPYSTFEDKTTLLRPDFQNWFHAATRVWVPPTHWTGLSKSVLMDLVCPAWSCPSQGKPKCTQWPRFETMDWDACVI